MVSLLGTAHEAASEYHSIQIQAQGQHVGIYVWICCKPHVDHSICSLLSSRCVQLRMSTAYMSQSQGPALKHVSGHHHAELLLCSLHAVILTARISSSGRASRYNHVSFCTVCMQSYSACSHTHSKNQQQWQSKQRLSRFVLHLYGPHGSQCKSVCNCICMNSLN